MYFFNVFVWVQPILKSFGLSPMKLTTEQEVEKFNFFILLALGWIEIASIYNVWPDTVDRWKQKIGLYTTEKSKYDSKKVRRKRLEEIINKTGKQIDELRLVDFYIKQLNGKSYRGLLWWYTAHYGYDLSQTRKHLIKEFVK